MGGTETLRCNGLKRLGTANTAAGGLSFDLIRSSDFAAHGEEASALADVERRHGFDSTAFTRSMPKQYSADCTTSTRWRLCECARADHERSSSMIVSHVP